MKSHPLPRAAVSCACVLSIAVYFFHLTGQGGLRTGFSHDDLMNIYRAWMSTLPELLKANLGFFLYPSSYRPFGGLFYHIFFNAFGLKAIPYRICILVFLLINIFLAYAFGRRLSGSREVGVITALLHGYHTGFVPLYRNTGTCYDIFCFTFYFWAFLYYARIRDQGRFLRFFEQLIFLGLMVLALDSKEMAVTLPVMIGLYELLYHPPRQYNLATLFRWLIGECRVVWWGAIFDAVYLASKIYSPGGVGAIHMYVVAASVAGYFRGWRPYFDEIFTTWNTNVFAGPNVVIFLLVMALVAWRSRRVAFRFGLLFFLVTALPVIFIPTRSMYAVYIPVAGFDLCAAIALIGSRDWLLARIRSLGPAQYRQAVTFVLLIVSLAWFYDLRGAHARSWIDDQSDEISAVLGQFKQQVHAPRKGARFLFLKDPFPRAYNADWGTAFISLLVTRDTGIWVDRAWKMPAPPDATHYKEYDYVFTVDEGRLTLLQPQGSGNLPVAGPRPVRPPWRPWPLVKVVLGAGLTLATMSALGLLVLSALRLKLYSGERTVFGFVVGGVLLSNIVFLLAALGWARKGVFLAVSALILTAFALARRQWPASNPSPPIPRGWKILSILLVTAFAWYYLPTALAPEVSPDGIAYHMGLVYQYDMAHGFSRITTNIYASLSQGLEMLFLFAFPFGKHPAAAVIHGAFLCALPLAMWRYGQRYGMPIAGLCGAVLTFAAPIAGVDGTIAYNDVAGACAAFVTFYLLSLWSENRDTRFLALAGLCAGFCYAIKYPLGIAAPYGLAVICFRTGWSRRRDLPRACSVFLLFAAATVLPWMIKDWIYVANPVAPFANRLFPNPYVTVDFEEAMRKALAHSNDLTLARLPWEVTVSGYRSTGLLGCIFLLAPLALLSLTKKEGRQLLTAAFVFALPVLANLNARFLLASLPFLSLAMAMALARAPLLAATVVLAHAITSWPPVLSRICHPYAWRIFEAPWSAALRRQPEADYLAAHVPEYPVSKMLERRVPPGGRIFSFERMAAAYCAREVLVSWWGAENFRFRDTMYLPLTADLSPMWRFNFAFPPQTLYGVRVVQTAVGVDIWKISELTLMHSGNEAPVLPSWQVTANPFPWNTNLALDRKPITYWRADRAQTPGMCYQIGFGGNPVTLDSVLLDGPTSQAQIRMKLQGEVAPGRWQDLAVPTLIPSPMPAPDLRRAATAELAHSGIGYVLVHPGDFIEKDVQKDPSAWGLEPVEESVGWHLYRIE